MLHSYIICVCNIEVKSYIKYNNNERDVVSIIKSFFFFVIVARRARNFHFFQYIYTLPVHKRCKLYGLYGCVCVCVRVCTVCSAVLCIYLSMWYLFSYIDRIFTMTIHRHITAQHYFFSFRSLFVRLETFLFSSVFFCFSLFFKAIPVVLRIGKFRWNM